MFGFVFRFFLEGTSDFLLRDSPDTFSLTFSVSRGWGGIPWGGRSSETLAESPRRALGWKFAFSTKHRGLRILKEGSRGSIIMYVERGCGFDNALCTFDPNVCILLLSIKTNINMFICII